MNSSQPRNLDWLFDDLAERLGGVRHAIILSTDGLLLARSTAMAVDEAEH